MSNRNFNASMLTLYNQGNIINRCNQNNQNNQNISYPVNNCDCPFLPLAGGTMTGTTAPIDNVFRLSGVPNSVLNLSSGTNSDIIVNSNNNININSILQSTTITSNNNIRLTVYNDSLTNIQSRVDIQPYISPMPYPIFDVNSVEYGLRVHNFTSTLSCGAYIGVCSEDIGELTNSTTSYGFLARRIYGNGAFGFRAATIFGVCEDDAAVGFDAVDVYNSPSSLQAVAGVQIYQIKAFGDDSTSGGRADGIRMFELYGSTVRGVAVDSIVASTLIKGLSVVGCRSNNYMDGIEIFANSSLTFNGLNIYSNNASTFTGSKITSIKCDEFYGYTISNSNNFGNTKEFTGYSINTITSNRVDCCVFKDIFANSEYLNGIYGDNLNSEKELKCINFTNVKSNSSTIFGALFGNLTGFGDCTGVLINNLISNTGSCYGLNISSLKAASAVGINLDIIVGDNQVANGIIISSVIGQNDISNGIYMNNLSSVNGQMNGINIENIYSKNGSIGLSIQNISTFSGNKSTGILISSINSQSASYGIVIKDITGGGDMSGIIIDTISSTAGAPLKGIDIFNLKNTNEIKGISINDISTITDNAYGISLTNISGDANNCYGLYISSINSLSYEAFGIYIGNISTGASYNPYPIYQASSINSVNLFQNRITCGESEPNTSEFISLNVEGTIRNKVQLTGTTQIYNILINGGNVIVSDDQLNDNIVLPDITILGNPIDGITYTIWKTHTQSVIINNNNSNINGSFGNFTFSGGAGTAYTKMTIVYINITIGWLARIG